MNRHSHAIPLPRHGDRVAGPAALGPLLPDLPGVRSRRLLAGETLIGEGQRLGSLAVVQAGALALALTGPGGRRAVVGVLGPGEILGEEGIGRDGDRPPGPWTGSPPEPWSGWPAPGAAVRPEARALGVCAVLLLPHHELERAVRHEPRLAEWMARSVSHRLADVQERLRWALSAGVHQRIQGTLRLLARRWGRPVPCGTLVDLPLSQDLLAAMVGASRETVNRALRDLRANGAVLRSGRRYVVVDASG